MGVKRKILNFVLILLVIILTCNGLFAQSDYKRIIFNCPVYFNNFEASFSDTLIVNGFSGDTLNVHGATNNNSYNTVINLSADSSTNLLNVNLSFTFVNSQTNCKTDKVTYYINDIMSNADTIYIDSFSVSVYYAYYPIQDVCINSSEIMSLETDLPPGSYSVNFPNGVKADSWNIISLSESTPGTYFYTITSDYCVNDNTDSSYFITINEPVEISLPDTFHLCANIPGYDSAFEGLNYQSADSSITIPVDGPLPDGFYLFSNNSDSGCYDTDTAYIQTISPLEINLVQTETCDNILVGINLPLGTAIETNWSTGSKSETIEVTNSDNIVVEVLDEFGCISKDSVYVSFSPLEIEGVNYIKEEADCWKDGSVLISDVTVKNSRGDYTSKLVNTLNGTSFDTMDEVPGGIYKLEFSDSRNCIKEYSEEITILQKCLEDYPIFSPNQDGVEDEYFIPYEGSVKIYDKNGSIITELTTPAYWNGADKDGNPVSMGNYVIVTDKGKPVNITIVR